jgi:hypothetical protein
MASGSLECSARLRFFDSRWPRGRPPPRPTTPAGHSRGVCGSSEYCMQQGNGTYWVVPSPDCHRRFCRGPPVCPLPPSPATYAAGSSSRELYIPCRVQQPAACPLQPRLTLRPDGSQEAPPLGFHPSSRHQPAAATYRAENPSPRYGPSSAFLPPSTVSSATGLAGLFHPAAASRVRPPGVCPSRWSRTRFPAPLALVPLNEPAFNQRARPRLQGLALHPECGGDEKRLSLSPLRAPHGLSSSGLSPPAPSALPEPAAFDDEPRYALPPMTFTAMSPPRLASGVLPMRESVCVCPRLRPARGFRPELPTALRQPGSRPTR